MAPLTHAVGNVLKRVFVIGFSIIVFGKCAVLLHEMNSAFMFFFPASPLCITCYLTLAKRYTEQATELRHKLELALALP